MNVKILNDKIAIVNAMYSSINDEDDNYFTGTKSNILHLLDNHQFELMRHDVTFPLYVEVDQIYNMACPASPIHYQYDPVQTTKTSVHGLYRGRNTISVVRLL